MKEVYKAFGNEEFLSYQPLDNFSFISCHTSPGRGLRHFLTLPFFLLLLS